MKQGTVTPPSSYARMDRLLHQSGRYYSFYQGETGDDELARRLAARNGLFVTGEVGGCGHGVEGPEAGVPRSTQGGSLGSCAAADGRFPCSMAGGGGGCGHWAEGPEAGEPRSTQGDTLGSCAAADGRVSCSMAGGAHTGLDGYNWLLIDRLARKGADFCPRTRAPADCFDVIVDRHQSVVGNPFEAKPRDRCCRAFAVWVKLALDDGQARDEKAFYALKASPPRASALDLQLLEAVARHFSVPLHSYHARASSHALLAWLWFHARQRAAGRRLRLLCWCTDSTRSPAWTCHAQTLGEAVDFLSTLLQAGHDNVPPILRPSWPSEAMRASPTQLALASIGVAILLSLLPTRCSFMAVCSRVRLLPAARAPGVWKANVL